MSANVTQQLVQAHLVEGAARDGGPPEPGADIALRIDQTLTQDATGTLVMLELEAMGLDRVRTDLSVQYVDHNLVQQDHRNPDDHAFLRSACRRFGIWFSPPGNGVSHPCHQERFGKPGATLLGADSHTPAAGALGMLAMGTGGLDVALAMAGEPYRLPMPEVWGVELVGELPPWVSAKDVILEMLRRHGVDGGLGRVVEYHGPGLAGLSAMDRHVIANMGAELGATTTVFPADDEVARFLESMGRAEDFTRIEAEPDAAFDHTERIDLSQLEPLVALPSSPGNVVPVREVAGREVHQVYLGSSANPGYRDFAVAAAIVRGQRVHERVSFDVNPTSRQMLENLAEQGALVDLLAAGARLHQAGCNGCIGMGQAPGTGRTSLRTVPRNFPGRSGTLDDEVCLVSPETAAASALAGALRDPRELGERAPEVREPDPWRLEQRQFLEPLPPEEAARVELVKGPGIGRLPELEPLGASLEATVILTLGSDVSTDEILPAGTRVLPLRSDIEAIARFAFEPFGEYVARAEELERAPHAVVAGRNYGQGSSREHAALAPRVLGLRVVLAESFARIHRRNLINFGVLPLHVGAEDREGLEPGARLRLDELPELLAAGPEFDIAVGNDGATLRVRHDLSSRERELLLAGGLASWMRRRLEA